MKIVIYGATSTVAQELEKLYAVKNNQLILIGRNPHQLERIRLDLTTRSSCEVTTIEQNLDDLVGNLALSQELCAAHSDIDLVIWAQGTLGNQLEAENDFQKSLSLFSSNFLTHMVGLTVFSKYFEDKRKGHIAVITSVAGDRGKRSNYIYGSAKAAKIAFLSGLRARLFSNKVIVTDIRMGFVDSKMTAQFPKGPLWISADDAASLIKQAIEQKKDIVYLPFFWRGIMCIINSIPEFIFKKLKL